jgi:methionyl-tRNA formyltransferase
MHEYIGIAHMNFAFFGTPWFAAIILEKLIAGGFVPSLVVCNPDRPVGRKKLLTAPAVKQRVENLEMGIRNKITILQPEKLSPSQFTIHNSQFDVFIVATYGKIIPRSIFTLPRLGTIGIHHSLLPRHRGPTPVQSAILAGDAEVGTTLFLMDEKIDHGPILAQERLNLENAEGSTLANPNYNVLETKLSELSGELLIKTIPDFLAGKIKPISQDESRATYTKKFTAQDAFISEEALSKATGLPNIERKIRALNPEPGVWTYAKALANGYMQIKDGNKRVKLLEAEIRDGKLILKKIQVEGKKPQSIG